MKNCFALLILLLLIVTVYSSVAAEPRQAWSRDHAVMVNAVAESSPKPKITLNWQKNELARQYIIKKKLVGDKIWSKAIATLDSSKDSYSDENVVAGQAYEYEVSALSLGQSHFTVKKGNDYVDSLFTLDILAYGYISSGVQIKPYDNPGKVLVLVDETMATPLNNELTRLKEDLWAEGWSVVVKTVARTESFNAEAVTIVKQIITEEYDKNPNSLSSVMLIGRVAVPYSGDMNPDGHPDHLGAWPADVYYGMITNDIWTDYSINDEGASRQANKNVIDDGKFDQSDLGGRETDIAVGRVDFYNMPKFSDNETELLRKYLDKDHAYRSGQISYVYKGLVDDNFNGMSEGFASSGWRNLGALVGKDNVTTEDFFTTLSTNKYLWAYGCGPGSWVSADGIGKDSNFAATQANAIFTMLFGSYFGDWDSPNNFMRSALASEPSILTCAWAGRPGWFFHHMGIGYPIGYSAKLTQSNYGLYNTVQYYFSSQPQPDINGLNGVHVALMGDPTLKMYMGTTEKPVAQPVNLNVIQPAGKDIELKWYTPPSSGLAGYNVYRSTMKKPDDEIAWVKLNDSLIKETSFVDKDFRYDGTVNYMVRAVMLQESFSGSFYNTGRGVIRDIIATGVDDGREMPFSFSCSPNPATDHVDISLSLPVEANASIDIFDTKGLLVRHITGRGLAQGSHSLSWNLAGSDGRRVPPGVYVLRLSAGERLETMKVVVLP